ncbi:MAG: recombinase family protein [Bacteroidetes bacterium]|nr:recombinase family protein [Bacteroidota bacterium]
MSRKIAMYARTSTTKQYNENQILVLKEYALKNGFEYDLYEEQESSRKTRPVKQELLRKLRAKEYDTCVIVSLSRWPRSSVELLIELQELADKGVNFVSIKDNLDFSSATGRLQIAILSAFSAFERELISERTKMGLERVRAQGMKQLGRPKGSSDKRPRKKSGYYLKEANKRKKIGEAKGIFMPIEHYINQKAN